MKRTLGLVLLVGMCLIVGTLAAVFVILNPQEVQLRYYFGFSWTGPLSWALFVSLLAGFVLGLLASLAAVLRARRAVGRRRREVRAMEQEIANLRALPLKDSI